MTDKCTVCNREHRYLIEEDFQAGIEAHAFKAGTYATYRGSYLAKHQGNDRHAMAAMATDLMQGLLVTDVTQAITGGAAYGVRYSRDAAVRLTAETFGADAETVESALAAAERYEMGVD